MMAAVPHIDLIGRVVLRRYRVVRELARGGMGVVYLARAEGASGFVRPVVVKLVLPEHAGDERVLNMFVREAKILSDLRHPSIVSILEFGQENGAYVMVLEYIHGYHLGQWNSYLSKVGRGVPVEILFLLILDVLGALHKAHEMRYPDGTSMGVVHRDVSPANILLDEEGRARVLDFGVARMRGASADYQTQVPTYVGKYSYGAPELIKGVEASAQSDLYSAAVVLHEVLLGRNTFMAERDALTVQRVMRHEPEAIEPLRRDVPRGLDAVLAKALAKTPEQRYASAAEFASALRALVVESEGVLRSRAAARFKQDFGEEMAQTLGVESLAARERSWRSLERASAPPPEPEERTMMVELGWTETVQSGSAVKGTKAEPVAPKAPVSNPGRVIAGKPARPRPPPAPPMAPPAPPAPPAPTVRPQVARRAAPVAPPAAPPSAPAVASPQAPSRPRAHAAETVRMPAVSAEAPRMRRSRLIALALAGGLVGMVVVSWLLRAPEPAPPAPAKPVAASQPDPAEIARQQAKLQAEREAALLRAREQALEARATQIDACFARVPKRLRPAAVEVAFVVDAAGKPGSVQAIPAAMAKTPVGRCLSVAGKRVQFEGTGAEEEFTLTVSP